MEIKTYKEQWGINHVINLAMAETCETYTMPKTYDTFTECLVGISEIFDTYPRESKSARYWEEMGIIYVTKTNCNGDIEVHEKYYPYVYYVNQFNEDSDMMILSNSKTRGIKMPIKKFYKKVVKVDGYNNDLIDYDGVPVYLDEKAMVEECVGSAIQAVTDRVKKQPSVDLRFADFKCMPLDIKDEENELI